MNKKRVTFRKSFKMSLKKTSESWKEKKKTLGDMVIKACTVEPDTPSSGYQDHDKNSITSKFKVGFV